MLHAAYLMPLFPLAGFAVLAVFGRKIGNPLAGWLATGTVTASFAIALVTLAGMIGEPASHRSFVETLFTWIPVSALHVQVGFLIDPLSLVMVLFVTGVSAVIHWYSIGYMAHDEGYARFFVYLNLFVASMLILVMASNLVFTFVGWEGVGLCSYFLIAFWYDRPAAASAGKKAFIMNRVGDAGFLLAMFVLFNALHTLSIPAILAHLGDLSTGTATAAALLLFLAATGKSAQIPLFTWLPDAMEGPTPVSALIHAATMVTAGVYLMVRMSPLLHRATDVSEVIAIVGVATALVAATIASTQNDIKKVIAYSTVSQIGYMFLAVGVGAYTAAIFLMVAHAFYKSLLFLSAGSVIHGLHDEQDIKKMGGLRKFMPWTFAAFMAGWLAIAGVPPLSAFWAKGAVLVHAFSYDIGLWIVGAITAVFTAYYMGREFYIVFYGDERWRRLEVIKGDPHESPWVMRGPLVILSVLAAIGGLLDLPFHPHLDFLSSWLAPVVGSVSRHSSVGVGGEWALAITDSVLAVIGVTLAWRLWRVTADARHLEPAFLQRAWLVDETYDKIFARGGEALAGFLANVVEAKIIDGAVNGTASGLRWMGSGLRRIQTGYVRNYAIGIVLGLVAILAWMLVRAGV